MPRVHLNIGSNLGDRSKNIGRAISALAEWPGLFSSDAQMRQSDAVESRPWGFDSPNGFTNVGISFETEVKPDELLDICQAVERSISERSHRNADGSYADRMIDIDIIFYGDARIDTPRLKVPHPLATQRDFAMIPLRQIDPDRAVILMSEAGKRQI